MADERTTTDPQQWRDLMSLSDDALLMAWNEARAACNAACAAGEGHGDAASWQGLIEGAAASRSGVGHCLDRYRARFPESGIGPEADDAGPLPIAPGTRSVRDPFAGAGSCAGLRPAASGAEPVARRLVLAVSWLRRHSAWLSGKEQG